MNDIKKYKAYEPSEEHFNDCVNKGQCAGHCCSLINVSVTLDEMKALLDAHRNDKKSWIDKTGKERTDFLSWSKEFAEKELTKLISMLYPVDVDLEVGDDGSVLYPIDNKRVTKETWEKTPYHWKEFYGCKHWDSESGLCTDYENRPNLCREHVSHKCGWKSCALKEHDERKFKKFQESRDFIKATNKVPLVKPKVKKMNYSKWSAEQIADSAKALGFTVFTKPYDLTLLSVRSKEQEANSFDDVFVALYHNLYGKLKAELFTSTTDSGLYYLKQPLSEDGTAIMVPNVQTRSCYKFQENGHKGYKAFRQVKVMPFVRDNNKDGKLDFQLYENPKNIFYSIIYANIHRATDNKLDASSVVGKWSAACQVLAEYFEWIRLCELAERQISQGHGDLFSYGILTEDKILN